MDDPGWKKHFLPIIDRAMPKLASLMDSDLLGSLLASGCITGDHYDELCADLSHWGKKRTARRLFQILRYKPAPSFTVFANAILEVEGGEELHGDLLMTSGCGGETLQIGDHVKHQASNELSKTLVEPKPDSFFSFDNPIFTASTLVLSVLLFVSIFTVTVTYLIEYKLG